MPIVCPLHSQGNHQRPALSSQLVCRAMSATAGILGSWHGIRPCSNAQLRSKGVQKSTNRRLQTKQRHNSLRQEATAAAGPAKANKPRPVRLGK